MGVLRQFNVLSDMRLDAPHLRLLESAIAGDFDTTVGRMQAGRRALVVSGLTIAGSAGVQATSLQLVVADAVVLNLNASESGSFLWVPADTANEILDGATNGAVTGAFVAGSTNYVGLDFVRAADDSTADLAKFIDPVTGAITSEIVPLGKTLSYTIVVGPTPFSAQPNVVPIAKVVVAANGSVTTITDARDMMFRLATGGDFPTTQSSYGWPAGRAEGAFSGADKSITSQKEWNDAVMTRLWELGGGAYWYSNVADRNVKLINTGSPYSNGEYFTFNSGTGAITWQGLRVLFDGGSTGITYNDVSSGSGTILDGECMYVDIDRTTAASLTGHIGPLTTVGTGALPGSRWILAWRSGTSLYTRDWRYPVGTLFTPATNLAQGVVRLNQAVPTPADPVVVAIGTNGAIAVAATAGNTTAATFTGAGQGSGVLGISGSSWSPAGAVAGVTGAGVANIEASGVRGIGSATSTAALGGPGIRGVGGAATGAGVAGPGGQFTGGSSSTLSVAPGDGVTGVGGGGAESAPGGRFTGGTGTFSDAAGVVGVGGAGSYGAAGGDFTGTGGSAGVVAVGGATNGSGGDFTGAGTAAGIIAEGGTSGGAGGEFTGGNNAGPNGGSGVRGTGGAGATNGGAGLVGIGGGTNGAGVSGTAAGASAYGLISVVGHVGCPTTNNFQYTGTQTGVLIVPGCDFSLAGPFSSGTSGALTANGLAPVVSSANVNAPHWTQGTVGVTEYLVGKINLPRGATITAVELWMENNTGASIGPGGVVTIKHHTYSGTGVPTTTAIINASTIVAVPNAGNGWYATTISPTASAMESGRTGSNNSGWVSVSIQLPSTASSVIRFGGLRVTYTYTVTDFMV